MDALVTQRGMIATSCNVTSITARAKKFLTARPFSSIKKVECVFSEEVTCPFTFVCKAR